MIHIITSSIRVDNLEFISKTIPDECNWIVKIDSKATSIPRLENATILYNGLTNGLWGHEGRNQVLDTFKFGDNDWIHFLDDDNIVHPNWYKEVKPLIDSNIDCSMITWAQEYNNGDEIYERLPANPKPTLNDIDLSCFIVRASSEVRFCPDVNADTIYASKNTNRVVTINQRLCYYNFLSKRKHPREEWKDPLADYNWDSKIDFSSEAL